MGAVFIVFTLFLLIVLAQGYIFQKNSRPDTPTGISGERKAITNGVFKTSPPIVK